MNVLASHLPLLNDRTRLARFGRALRRVIRPGDTVLDLGAGTGILGLMALRAGAREVLAIERSPVIEVARCLAAANRMEHRIRWFHGPARKVRLPRRANVIVTETLGDLGVNEGVLALAADARRRFLAPGGTIIPAEIELFAQAVRLPVFHRNWITLGKSAGNIPLRGLSPVASNSPWILPRWPATGMSPPRRIFRFRLDGIVRAPLPAEGKTRLPLPRGGICHGIIAFFRATLAPGIHLDSRGTSWKPVWFPVETPLATRRGDALEFTLRIESDFHYSWRFVLRRRGRAIARQAHSTLFLHAAARTDPARKDHRP
ncbi:MAG: 50S ribosomal protein L11 methyltransferase [Planctomycetota bacterium]